MRFPVPYEFPHVSNQGRGSHRCTKYLCFKQQFYCLQSVLPLFDDFPKGVPTFSRRQIIFHTLAHPSDQEFWISEMDPFSQF